MDLLQIIIPVITAIASSTATYIYSARSNRHKFKNELPFKLQEGYTETLERLSEITDKWQRAEAEIAQVRVEVASLKASIEEITAILTQYEKKYGKL